MWPRLQKSEPSTFSRGFGKLLCARRNQLQRSLHVDEVHEVRCEKNENYNINPGRHLIQVFEHFLEHTILLKLREARQFRHPTSIWSYI